MDIRVKKYQRDFEFSYTLGRTLTEELIKFKKESIYKIYINSNFTGNRLNNFLKLCEENNLIFEINNRIFERLAIKDNTYVIGVFLKYDMVLEKNKPHVVLVNPSDSGNLGTIIRTGVGFGFNNIAIIKPGVDLYMPKVIAATMGAFFHSNVVYYNSFGDYCEEFKDLKFYTFMLEGKKNLDDISKKPLEPFSLVFGNEATGLPAEFLEIGESIRIHHSSDINSLNLSVSFGIAAYKFSR